MLFEVLGLPLRQGGLRCFGLAWGLRIWSGGEPGGEGGFRGLGFFGFRGFRGFGVTGEGSRVTGLGVWGKEF